MFGNGVGTGIPVLTTAAARRTIRQAQPAGGAVCCAVATGAPLPLAAVCHAVSAAIRATATSTGSVFAGL